MLLAFTVNSFVYFSFVNIYSAPLLNAENFQQQYSSGIYQYRFLSSSLLLWIYNLLQENQIAIRLKLYFWEKNANQNFFLSYYLLNTFFLILSAVMMVLLTEFKKLRFYAEQEKFLFVVLGIFSIVVTQFVLVPYDCSSYFLLLLFFWFFLKYIQNFSLANLGILGILMLVSTINRETAALSISLVATVLFFRMGFTKKSLLPVFFLGAIFLAVYLSIRFYFGNFRTNDGNLLTLNFSMGKNLMGILFWLSFFLITLFLADSAQNRKSILIFHLFSLPYILMCFYSGVLYEVRLYVPLFLTALFLGRYNHSHQIT